MLGLAACNAGEPAPQKLEKVSPFERGADRRPEPDPNDPLRNPATEAPLGPDGEQVSDAEIQEALAEAARQAEVGNPVAQRNALRACANKTPPSARCDGEMGLTQIESRTRRAAALYHLSAAAQNDEPEASAELYARVGAALRKHGKLDDAIAALRLAVARDDSADNLFMLGQTLSLRRDELPEAIEHIAAARAKDDRLEWLYEQAVLSGQLPIRERAEAAVELFAQYLERAKAAGPGAKLPAKLAPVEVRMKELEGLAKTYSTQAEFDAKVAAAAEASGADDEGEGQQANQANQPEAPVKPQ